MRERILLLIAAFVWGCAFVAQRVSTDIIGPFAFNGLRFWLGALSILPAAYFLSRKTMSLPKRSAAPVSLFTATCILGFLLFTGAALQQIGLIYTTAGKSGFITALYIVLVPIISLIFGNALRLSHIIGCITAVTGVYFLSFTGSYDAVNAGDVLTLAGALFWTLHIVTVSRFVRYHDGLKLSIGQFFICGFLNFAAMILVGEPLTPAIITAAAWPIIYCAVFSTGIGFTFQILGQKGVPPTEASLICSLEMVFSLLSGYIILNERLTLWEIAGVILMSIGIVAAQLPSRTVYGRREIPEKS